MGEEKEKEKKRKEKKKHTFWLPLVTLLLAPATGDAARLGAVAEDALAPLGVDADAGARVDLNAARAGRRVWRAGFQGAAAHRPAVVLDARHGIVGEAMRSHLLLLLLLLLLLVRMRVRMRVRVLGRHAGGAHGRLVGGEMVVLGLRGRGDGPLPLMPVHVARVLDGVPGAVGRRHHGGVLAVG